MSEIKPETQAEIILSNWLQTNNIPVWYNRKIKELNNQNIFKTQGESKKKPDMIIYSQFLKVYGAIEIKPGITNAEIYNASKIIKYQKEYKERKTKYYIDGKEVDVNFFIVATKHSIKGHLFEKEIKITPDDEKWHKKLLKYKNEPPIEYNRSKSFLRHLWAIWREERGKNEPGIGVLLSSCLDGIDSIPKIFYQTYENKRWNVRWRKI